MVENAKLINEAVDARIFSKKVNALLLILVT